MTATRSMRRTRMRGPKPPRPDAAALQRRLGLPLGPVMRALVAAARELRPDDPELAFEAGLNLRLSLLGAGELRRLGTPANATPFAHAFGLVEYSFLAGGSSTDDSVIVRWAPKDLDDEPHAVAPDLATFLGLVAIVGAEAVRRGLSEAGWRRARSARASDERRRAAARLLAIDGVRAPEHPEQIVARVPELPPAPRAPSRRARPERRAQSIAACRELADQYLARDQPPSAAEWHVLLAEFDRLRVPAKDPLRRRVADAAARAARMERDFF